MLSGKGSQTISMRWGGTSSRSMKMGEEGRWSFYESIETKKEREEEVQAE